MANIDYVKHPNVGGVQVTSSQLNEALRWEIYFLKPHYTIVLRLYESAAEDERYQEYQLHKYRCEGPHDAWRRDTSPHFKIVGLCHNVKFSGPDDNRQALIKWF